MWVENVQICPKITKNYENWPKNIQKVCKLLQNSYLGQKPWDFPLKSYCWSPNLLGSSFLASDTISTSVQKPNEFNQNHQTKSTYWTKHTKVNLFIQTYRTQSVQTKSRKTKCTKQLSKAWAELGPAQPQLVKNILTGPDTFRYN